MDLLLKEFILCLWILTVRITQGSSRDHDICDWDTFDASCADNEVIQIEQAYYGRMSLGKCINQEYGHLGCKLDVKSYIDTLCSGRQSCNLRTPDENLDTGKQPCPDSLETYLQIKYNCVKVYTSQKQCAGEPLPVSGTKGLLSNMLTGRTGQGSEKCPWKLQGSPGQNIRLTLHDYGVWSPPGSQRVGSSGSEAAVGQSDQSGVCRIYARINEVDTESSITICGGETREKVVYTSETDTLHISLANPKHSQNPTYFILQYEVFGCPKYKPPDGAVIEESDEKSLSVRCLPTGGQWRLQCDNKYWIAAVGERMENCTSSGEASALAVLFGSPLALPKDILITIIVAAAIILAAIITAIGLVCLGSKRRPALTSNVQNEKESDYPTHKRKCVEDYQPMLEKHHGTTSTLNGRDYTTSLHRNTAAPPSALTADGDFKPLPPLPPAQDTMHWPYPRSLDNSEYSQDGRNHTLKPSNSKPIYEQTRFSRRSVGSPFYQELDIERNEEKAATGSGEEQSNTGTLNPGSNRPCSPDGYLTARLQAEL